MAHVTELYRVINCVLETKTSRLKMVPNFKDGIWKLEALSDIDFEMTNTQDAVFIYTLYIFVVFRLQ